MEPIRILRTTLFLIRAKQFADRLKNVLAVLLVLAPFLMAACFVFGAPFSGTAKGTHWRWTLK